MDRPVLRYFGGKFLLAPWIISHMPKHRVYVEPYGGAASVLMQKPRAYAEIYNDLDEEVVGLFRVLQDRKSASELEYKLRLTPFSRDEFNLAYDPSNDPIEIARRIIIRAYMGFGADGHNKENGRTGFRASSNRSGTTPAHDWTNFPKEISSFCERLQGVVIENRDALKVMEQQDSSDTLHFVDPPYVLATRGTKNAYKFEMSNTEHETLLAFLEKLSGMVMICGYQSEIYDRLGWKKIERASLADGARKRIECLWFNQSAERNLPQPSLF